MNSKTKQKNEDCLKIFGQFCVFGSVVFVNLWSYIWYEVLTYEYFMHELFAVIKFISVKQLNV